MEDFIRVTIGTEAENLNLLGNRRTFMKIIIIGLGLIGGSIAKSLSSSKDHEILAFDIDQRSIKNALDNKSISDQ